LAGARLVRAVGRFFAAERVFDAGRFFAADAVLRAGAFRFGAERVRVLATERFRTAGAERTGAGAGGSKEPATGGV
jgi:hypothetical protein